jgi:hypothetical protein
MERYVASRAHGNERGTAFESGGGWLATRSTGPGTPPFVAIAPGSPTRILVPRTGRGYDVYRVDVRCDPRSAMPRDAMGSASDDRSPYLPTSGNAPALDDAIRIACDRGGTLVPGLAGQVAARLRAMVGESRADADRRMSADIERARAEWNSRHR